MPPRGPPRTRAPAFRRAPALPARAHVPLTQIHREYSELHDSLAAIHHFANAHG